MPRRREIEKRTTLPDPKYGDDLVSKFVNVIMRDGKKSTAQMIFYRALDRMQEQTGEEPLALFRKALDRSKPQLEVKSRRVGGSTYQVPVPVRDARQVALASRWLVQFARERHEKSMEERLAGELIDAANGRGATIKKREDTHRMAEANKAFAHYRW
ncbi:MAG: 30S ribosomal protein S7 [bacterium]